MFPVLTAIALVATQGVTANAIETSRIVVEGYGSAKSPANVARLSYDVQGEGKTSDQAVSDLVARSASVESALRSMDASITLHSDAMRVQTVRGNDCKDEERYDESVRLSTGPCAIAGYVAKQDFTVRTSRITEAGTMVGLAGRQGAFDPKIDSFGLTDDRTARREAIAIALADARAKAEAIAAGSNGHVGQLLSASLDGASEVRIMGQDEISVSGTRIRMQNVPITVKVDPGPAETTARVTVTYVMIR
jgi:uncharacterized protein